jgi:hypothetical protein
LNHSLMVSIETIQKMIEPRDRLNSRGLQTSLLQHTLRL